MTPRAMNPLERALRAGPPPEHVHDREEQDPMHMRNERVKRAAARADLIDVAVWPTDTPVGEMVLAATADGLVACGWGREHVYEQVAEHISPRIVEDRRRLDPARRQLDEYFAGRRTHFDVPIDWALSHGFRREVLQELKLVPFGTVVTYRDLAVRAGSPGASRAVGSAMATNPIAIIVPCHRVLRTGGGLGGYSGRDGLVTKEFLLRHEGAML